MAERRLWIVPAMVLLVFVWLRRDAPLLPQDHGQMLVYPRLLADGWVPWRDFETIYGPLGPWLLRIGYAAGGWSVDTLRVVGVIYAAVLVAAVGVTARRIGGEGAAVAGACIAAVMLGLFTELTPATWNLGFAMVLLSTGGAGVLAGAACALRPDLAVAALVTARRSWRWVAGLLIGAAPLLVYVAMVGPFAVADGTVLNGARSAPWRRVPIDGSNIALAVTLLMAVGVACCTLWRSEPRVVAVVVLGLPYAFQRLDGYHAAPVLAVSLGLLPAALHQWGPRRALVAGMAVLAVVIPSHLPVRHVPVGVVMGREWPGMDADLAATVQVAAAYGGHLFAGPADLRRSAYGPTHLYYLTGMDPSGPWLEFNPENANRDTAELVRQIAAADVVVLSSEWDDFERVPIRSTEPRDVVDERFGRVYSAGPWEVWVKN